MQYIYVVLSAELKTLVGERPQPPPIRGMSPSTALLEHQADLAEMPVEEETADPDMLLLHRLILE